MRRKFKKSLKELIQENKEQLLNDKLEMDRIEERIEKRHEIQKLA